MTVSAPSLLAELSNATIDPAKFGHAEHIMAGHEALQKFAFFDAVQMVADGLRATTLRHGATGKYNATLTLAFMSLIAERMAEAPPNEDARQFLARNPDLLDRRLMDRWYSGERLWSDLARRAALMPDRAASP